MGMQKGALSVLGEDRSEIRRIAEGKVRVSSQETRARMAAQARAREKMIKAFDKRNEEVPLKNGFTSVKQLEAAQHYFKELARVHLSDSARGFVSSLADQAERRGRLTTKQYNALLKVVERHL